MDKKMKILLENLSDQSIVEFFGGEGEAYYYDEQDQEGGFDFEHWMMRLSQRKKAPIEIETMTAFEALRRSKGDKDTDLPTEYESFKKETIRYYQYLMDLEKAFPNYAYDGKTSGLAKFHLRYENITQMKENFKKWNNH